MRRIAIAILVLLPLTNAAADPVPVVEERDPQQVEVVNFPETQFVTGTVTVDNLPSGPSQFEFVGVTTATFDGSGNGGGWFAMTTACEAEFPGSRMIYTDEYFETVSPPAFEQANAWAQPRIIGTVVRRDTVLLVESTGSVSTPNPSNERGTGSRSTWMFGRSSSTRSTNTSRKRSGRMVLLPRTRNDDQRRLQ